MNRLEDKLNDIINGLEYMKELYTYVNHSYVKNPKKKINKCIKDIKTIRDEEDHNEEW